MFMYPMSSATSAIVDFWSLMPWLTEKFQDILFVESDATTLSLTMQQRERRGRGKGRVEEEGKEEERRRGK